MTAEQARRRSRSLPQGHPAGAERARLRAWDGAREHLAYQATGEWSAGGARRVADTRRRQPRGTRPGVRGGHGGRRVTNGGDARARRRPTPSARLEATGRLARRRCPRATARDPRPVSDDVRQGRSAGRRGRRRRADADTRGRRRLSPGGARAGPARSPGTTAPAATSRHHGEPAAGAGGTNAAAAQSRATRVRASEMPRASATR